jgi:putative flippase GtrA
MRFLKFGVVGVANTLITLAVFNLVAVVLGWPAGFANSFVWNRRWTFADRTGIDTPRSLARFAVAGLCALLASSGIILALQQIAQGMRLDLSGALVLNGIELLAISVSLGVNYALATRWAFPEDPA